jgi:hypothetical protein
MTGVPPSPDVLADLAAIDELLARYARAIDTRDWELLREVFSDGGVVDYSALDGPRGLVAEVVPWLETALAGFSASQHLITNREVTVDGDAATGRCSLFNPMVMAGGPVMLVGGAYTDRFVRTAAGWRFTERVAHLVWSTTL